MKELTVLSVLLAGLGVASYVSHFEKKTDAKVETKKVVLIDAKLPELSSVSLVTRTQTVTLERKEGYVWFEVETKTGKKGFVGNKETDELLKKLAPFEAIRGLGGELAPKELEEAKLKKPERKLIVRVAGGDRVYDLGGRTFGSRDHYVRPKGKSEVYLVESRVLGDLEYPEGRFMQRKLREVENKDVTEAVIRASGRERKVLHQNRLSQTDAYWAAAEKPDAKDETLENFLDKIDKLTVRRYATPSEPFPKAEPFLEVAWIEDAKEREKLVLSKAGAGPSASFYAESSATRQPVEISRAAAEQLELDLKSLF